MTTSIDSLLPVRQLQEFATTVDSAAQRTKVELVARHMRMENVDHDVDGVMATLVPDPVYHFYGLAPQTSIVAGVTAVRQMYLASMKSGPNATALDIDRIVVDDSAVVFSGVSRMLGRRAVDLFPELMSQIDPRRESLVEKSLLVFIPFTGELMSGEDMYFAGPYGAENVTYL